MADQLLKFNYGSVAQIKAASQSNGSLYIATDARALYVDLEGTRYHVSDFITVANQTALEAGAPWTTECFYYVTEGNMLLRYKGNNSSTVFNATDWTQVNSTASLQAELTALAGRVTTVEGKATTNATAIENLKTLVGADKVSDQIDAKINALDLPNTYEEKGAAAIVQGNLDTYKGSNDATVKTVTDKATANEVAINELSELVGTLPESTSATNIVDYVDAKTANIASDETVSALAARVKAVEDDYLTSNDKTALSTAINEAKTALENADTGLDTRIKTLEGQITGLSGAMHFKGVEDAIPEDVSSYVDGDVIIVGEKEYVFSNGAFVLFGDVSAEGERLTALETHANTYGPKVDTLETAMNTAQGDIATLKTANEGLTTRLSTVEGKATDNANAITGLTTRIGTAENEITSIKNDYLKAVDKTELEGKITAEATARAQAIETVNTTISGIDTRVQSVEAQLKWVKMV